jgi:TIR domain
MQRDTFAGRLVAALARNTPAFQPAATQSSPRSAARLVAAVSRTTPAFNPPTTIRSAPPSPPPIVSEASKPTTSGREFSYDVFVSYSHRDPVRTWVRSVLVPKLEAAGLRVSVDYRFHLGAPLVAEMERAIEQSRYTLAVLSPDYLANEFTDLERVFAEQFGLEEGGRRLIGVMREPSRLPLRFQLRVVFDLSKVEDRPEDLSRLVQQLQGTRGE